MIREQRVLEIAELVKKVGEEEALRQLGISAESLGRYLRYARALTNFSDNPLDTNVKILVFDIETAPTTAYVWKRWKNNVSQDMIVTEGYMLCYAAKWLGDSETLVDALPFYNDYESDKENDRNVCSSLYELFNAADIIVAHNGNAFDIPLVKTRFLYHGFNPPAPYKAVDTKLIAKSEFRFPSNALDSIGAYLGVGRKIDHEGFTLWSRCLDGDRDAWKNMVDYNIGDVDLLEKIYLKMRPWYSKHPAVDVYNRSGVMRCKVCGSTHLREDNMVYTNISGFTSYQCEDCGHWNRGRQNQRSKDQMKTTLMNISQ